MPRPTLSYSRRRPVRRGSVFQRHTRKCPRDTDGTWKPHKCRGAWSFHVGAGRRSDGSRRQITRSGYRTKRDAETALAEALAREDAGVAEVHGLTVGAYLCQWLQGKRSLRPKTVDGYRFDIDRYLVPAIGAMRLADLRPHHVDQMYGDLMSLADRPATPSTIRHLHTTLRSALNTAVKRRLIPWNPALHVELPEESRRPTTVWTPDQLQRFLESVADHRLFALFRLVATAGLRRGEALGLHWVDVDLEGAAFTVRWQLVDAGGGPQLGPPKTKTGARVVTIDQVTVSVLRRHREAQQAERHAWGEAWKDTGLVFTREDGAALRPDAVSHLFAKLTRNASLVPIRLHDLRHTNASLALAAGIPLKVVSDRLGHSSIAITSNLYTHVIPAVARDAAERIGTMLGGDTRSPDESAASALLAQNPTNVSKEEA